MTNKDNRQYSTIGLFISPWSLKIIINIHIPPAHCNKFVGEIEQLENCIGEKSCNNAA